MMSEAVATFLGKNFRVESYHFDDDGRPLGDDVDLLVYLQNGSEYVCTVSTLLHLGKKMERYRRTGERKSGTYAYVADLVILQEITSEAILQTVADLIETGEIETAMSKIDNSWLDGD